MAASRNRLTRGFVQPDTRILLDGNGEFTDHST